MKNQHQRTWLIQWCLLALALLVAWPCFGKSTRSTSVRRSPKPSIVITRVPPPGAGENTWGQIAGQVRGVTRFQDYRVICYALGDTYYVQPYANDCRISISQSGGFELGTHLGYGYVCLLVKAGYQPPATTATLPRVGGAILAVAHATPKK